MDLPDECKRVAATDQQIAAMCDNAKAIAAYRKALEEHEVDSDFADTLIRDWQYLLWYGVYVSKFMPPRWWSDRG